MKKVRIFDLNHGLTPLKNFRFFGHIRYIFLWSRKASFLSRTSTNIISGPIFNKKKNNEESSNFWPKAWVNSFGKFFDFSDIQDTYFYGLERLLFYLQHPQTSFLGLFSIKRNNEESWNIWPKSWVNPFGKFPIVRTYKIHLFIV